MGFTKLDSGIIDSSIWAEPIATRVVWVTFLAKANRNGFVAASHSGMQRASNVPLDEFDDAVKCLESPDPDSRSSEHDGRRIEKTPGGWQILNYRKYREFSYSDSKSAVIKRMQREKKRGQSVDTSGHVHFSSGHSASASASASEFKNLWKEWPVIGRQKKAYCERKFNAMVKAGQLAEFQAVTKGYFIFLAWQKNENNFEQRAMNLSTWLNNWEGEKDRYLDKDGKPMKPEPRL